MDLINCLMDGVLIDIFGYLSPRTIKNCSLVCKRWNDVISNSREIMMKYRLRLMSTGCCEKAKEVQRKHCEIITRCLDKSFMDLLDYHNLHTLIIFSISLKLSDLVKALQNVPKLQTLDLSNSVIDSIQDIKEAPKIRLNLKKLCCNPQIFHIFDCNLLEDLSIHWCEFRVSNVESYGKMLFDFMNRQKNLHTLLLHGSDLFRDFEGLACQYQLKILTVQYSISYEGLIKFIDLHKNSVKVLKIYSVHTSIEAIEQIQKYVLTSLPNLKDLLLILKTNGPAIEMFNNQPHQATYVTKNIERLEFNSNHRSLDENKRFIDMFSNIKYVSVDLNHHHDVHKLVQYISSTKLSLESVHIDLSFYHNQPMIYFPNLKFFGVKYYFEEEMNTFIGLHSSTLEEIEVNCLFGINESTVTEINKCNNLRKISFRSFKNEYLLKMIKTLAKHLVIDKPLELTISYYPKTVITFKLPEDGIFLNNFSINNLQFT